MAAPPPWQRAWERIEREKKGTVKSEVWRAFETMDGDEKAPESFIQQLKHVRSQVDEKYSPRFCRAVELLDLVRTTGGQVVQYGPQTVGIAFTAFSFVFEFVTADKDLCDTISMTIESVIHWIFLGEIFTRRYSHEIEDASSRSNAQELANAMIEGTIDLFVIILEICLKIVRLKLRYDAEATSDDSKDKDESVPWIRTKCRVKKTTERVSNSLFRRVLAFFGKGSEIQGMLEYGKEKLAVLQRNAGLSFQEIAESQLKDLKRDIQDLPQRLHRALDPLQESLNRVEWTVMETKAKMERMERRLGQDEFNENLLWLQSGTALPIAQPRDRQRELKPAAGTCDWIFNHERYQSWKSSKAHVCWLFGEAGVGKSYVTSSVIEKFVEENDDSLVLSFFCQTGSESSSRCKYILLHLLIQLFRSCTALEPYEDRRECLEIIKRARFGQGGDEYREKIQREERKPNMMLMEEIQAAFFGLLRVFRKKVFIIVDAFDECIDPKAGGLVDALVEKRTPKGQQNVFLWISSRPEDHLREVADKGIAEGQFNVVEMKTEDNDDNIRAYLKAAFKEMSHLPQNRRDRAQKIILEQSRGSFLRASTAINALCGEKAIFDIMQALDDLPMDMNRSWQQKWESLSLFQRKWLSIAFRWLVHAYGTITTTLIADEIEKKYYHRLQEEQELGNAENDNPDQRISKSDGEDDEITEETIVLQPLERPSIKALREFARDFLEFHVPDRIQLRSRDIRDWLLDGKKEEYYESSRHCPRCSGHMQSASIEEVVSKNGSLGMALYILRTINNREFQKEHLFRSGIENEDYNMFMDEKMYPDGNVLLQDWFTSTASDKAKSSKATQGHKGGQIGGAKKTKQYHDTLSVVEAEATDYASDAGSEDGALIAQIAHLDYLEGPPDNLNEDTGPRYEFYYWEAHMRDAEEQWRLDERTSKDWDELYSLAEKFLDGRSPAFRAWMREYVTDQTRPVTYDVRLHDAAGYGIVGLMDRFIDQGDSMSKMIDGYGTPLHAACRQIEGEQRLNINQYKEIFDRSNFAINIQEVRGETPVFLLVKRRAPLEIIELIVEKYGARLDIPLRWRRDFPIHWAIVHPDAGVCRYLLGQPDCSPNVVDQEGETPLHWLLHLHNASPQIAKILIDHGANVCAKDNQNQQPLYEAARTDNFVIGEMLLQHNACVDDIENTRNWTALHQAVSKGHVDFVNMLLRHSPGPDITLEDKRSRTALHLAAKYGHQEILKAMLKYLAGSLQGNAEEGPANSDRETQAHPYDEILRTEMDSGDKIKALLEKPDYRGNTPLHKAAAYGHVDCMKLIIGIGNAKELCSMKNDVGATPLHLPIKVLLHSKHDLRKDVDKAQSSHNGKIDGEHIRSCMQLLLKNGADPNAQDKSGKTPLRLAVDAKDSRSVQLLVLAGADPMQPVCSSDETTVLQKIVEPWRDQDMTSNDNEELVKALLRSSKKLPQEVCVNILNIALERRAVEVLKSFTARFDDKDQHGWSILALAVQFREGSLIDRILLPRPESYFPKWSSTDRHEDVIVSEDGMEVSCPRLREEPQGEGCRAVRADFPIPPGVDRYYYEIEIVECGSIGTTESAIGVGFASQFLRLDTMPGWSSPYQSWGYHGDDGHKYDNMSIIEDGHPYGQGDTVGAGVDFANREIFFTKNGKRLGTSFSGENVKGKLFPMVGFHACGVKIRTNFGTREFKHPVDWCKVQPAGEAPAA